jgi:hypothetical protein
VLPSGTPGHTTRAFRNLPSPAADVKADEMISY